MHLNFSQKLSVFLLGMILPAFLNSCGSGKPEEKSETPEASKTEIKPELAKEVSGQGKMPEILKDESKLPNWLPDQKILEEKLKHEVKPEGAFLPFAVHFPDGMSVFTNKNYAFQTFNFIAKERKDTSRASFLISFVPKFKNQKQQDTIWDCQQSGMEGMKTNGPKTNWTQSPLEAGKINGITFLRQHWQGSIQLRDRVQKLKGFIYTGKLGDMLIVMASQDEEPYCEESLKHTENAILSFKQLKVSK